MIDIFQKIIDACELNKNQKFTTGDLSSTQYHLQNALWLASLGYYIFPTRKNKKPYYKFKWREKSTNNTMMIFEYWQQYQQAMVAIDCGKSGITILDIDTKNDKKGLEALEYRLKNWGDLPDNAPVILSPTGGLHIYFKSPECKLQRGFEGCVEIQQDGFYIISPNSVNEFGKAYMPFNQMLAKDSLPTLPDSWIKKLSYEVKKTNSVRFKSCFSNKPFNKKVYNLNPEELYGKCDFYSYCVDNSSDLEYTHWFWFAAMLSGYESGNEIFHRHSENYYKYCFDEAETLYQNAIEYHCRCDGMRERFEVCKKCNTK